MTCSDTSICRTYVDTACVHALYVQEHVEGMCRLRLLLLQDLNHDPTNPHTRLYATHAAQPYHNDASDIVGKLLLNLSCRL